MSYKSWLSGFAETGTSQFAFPFEVTDGFPLDFRTIKQSFNEVLDVSINVRYPGLTVYNTEDGIEYTYIPNANKLFSKPNVKEYHPELAHFKSIDSSSLPQDLPNGIASVRDILNNPASVLGDGSFENNGTTYHTIPDGAEGVIKVLDNGGYSYYSYVWNGDTNEWIPFTNSGSGGSSSVILNFSNSDNHVGTEEGVSNPIGSINELTSGDIDAKYRESTNNNGDIEQGTEASVVFTKVEGSNESQTTATSFRKYVYLGSWLITQGTQEYVIELSSKNEVTNNTEWNALTAENFPSGSSDVEIIPTDHEGTVDVIISHQFNSQYIDAFVFEQSGSGRDQDYDNNVDAYGDRILAPAVCFKSGNVLKIKIPLPLADDTSTTYSITLQK